MDADQRAELIRDLDKAAREASRQVAAMQVKFRELLADEDDPELSVADTTGADQALINAARDCPELVRIFGKLVRLLDGPPPRLALRASDEPERLDIIARTPDADLDVGYATRTRTGDGESWHITLTDAGGTRKRAGIGLFHPAAYEDLLEAVTRHMDDHGPWWATEAPGGNRSASRARRIAAQTEDAPDV